jgi:hypothetical protein
MIDLDTWEALREQGLGPEESVAAIAGMLAGRLDHSRVAASRSLDDAP